MYFHRRHSLLVQMRILAALCVVLGSMLVWAQPAAARPAAQLNVVDVLQSIPAGASVTWTSGNIYFIKTPNFTVEAGATLTIEPGTIVKFQAAHPLPTTRYRMIVNGALILPDVGQIPVTFTSGRDDSLGGDTNLDLSGTTPSASDWEGLIIQNPSQEVDNIVVRYARYGLQLKNPGTSIISHRLHHNLLANNFCGITLTVDSSGGINNTVDFNTFQDNHFGFCTTQVAAGDSGRMTPTLASNTFARNRQLPIYLMGTAQPVYADTNHIEGYDPTNQNNPWRHLGIGLGGTIHSRVDLPLVNGYALSQPMPYVVVSPLTIHTSGTLAPQPGTVMKFYTRSEMPVDPSQAPDPSILTAELADLDVLGALELPTPDPANPIIFTSYHDDEVKGDTNGDGSSTSPAPGDWFQAAVHTNSASINFNNFAYLQFRYAQNGLFYEVTGGAAGTAVTPRFDHLKFIGNVNGLRIKSYNGGAFTPITPTITNCTFEQNGRTPLQSTLNDPYKYEHGVPLYLENNVHLAADFNTQSNVFINNLHPAVGVAGAWRVPTTWAAVAGQSMNQMPYLVHGKVSIGSTSISNAQGKDDSMTLTLPAGTVVNFNVYIFDRNYQSSIQAAGALILQGDASHPVIFTSIYDNDPYDISHDPVAATRADWLNVESRHPASQYGNVIVRHAEEGLYLHNTGDYDIPFGTLEGVFEENTIGLYMNVDMSGDIGGTVTGAMFSRNDYGLKTMAKVNTSLGISKPYLTNNTFEFHSQLPILLAGSASPTYSGNIFSNNTHRAIGITGYFGSNDDPITLPRVAGDTNAPFNAKTFPYAVMGDTTFDWQTQTTMQGGLVFKAVDNAFLKFFGLLTVQTTNAQRNYFTSYQDDYYDDTDAALPPPALSRKEWTGVYLYNPFTASFSHTTFAHAEYGLVLFQDRENFGNLEPQLINNTYTLNQHGLTLWIESDFDIIPSVTGSYFTSNDYGLYTYTNPSAVIPHTGTSNPVMNGNQFTTHAQFPIYLNGTADPDYNNIIDDPTYKVNTFTGSTHPAIAVGGTWSTNDIVAENLPTATWSRVVGDGGKVFPYVVLENVMIEMVYTSPVLIYAKIALPPRSLIKFDEDRHIYAWGELLFQSTPGNEITFTSYRDDAEYFGVGGDTNASTSAPKRDSWKSVWLIDIPGKNHEVHDTLSKYAVDGFTVFYSGEDAAAHITTSITRARMQECTSGMAMVVGWYKDANKILYGGKGSIHAVLTDIVVENSDYGMITVAHNLSTGIVKPTLTGVTFNNIEHYPMFLGGTSEPVFAMNNQVFNDPAFEVERAQRQAAAAAAAAAAPEPAEMLADSLEGFDQPGNAEGQRLPALPGEETPAPTLSAAPLSGANLAVMTPQEFYPAIAIGGSWNNTVLLPSLDAQDQIPYAVVGSFPVEFIVDNVSYKPKDDIIVGETAPLGANFISLGIQPGAVFKFAPSRKMTVTALGDLSMQTTSSRPAIFTSIRDDSAGGDTNDDGALTRPAAGDWPGLIVSSQKPKEGDVYGFLFHDAVVRYAAVGLNLLHDDMTGSAIAIEVKDSSFLYNTTGITLNAVHHGSIDAWIHNSRFTSNGTHISGMAAVPGYIGRLIVKANNNNLLGMRPQAGISNNNVSPEALACITPNMDCDFDASSNYWGAASGPYHPTKRPTGQGTTVSDRVEFEPFLANAVPFDSRFAIRGRVTGENFPYDPMQGVHIVLVGTELETVTDENGYYQFENIPAGQYSLIAYQENYTFTPAQIFVTLSSDAPGLNFSGSFTPNSGGTRQVSVIPVNVVRPTTAGKVVTVTIRLDAPNSGPTIRVNYTVIDGSAVVGEDYSLPPTPYLVTFLIGQQEKTFTIPLIPAASSSGPDEYFTVELSLPSNSGNVQIEQGLGVITITEPKIVTAPYITRR